MTNRTLWPKIEPLLAHVEKPTRYLSGEWGEAKTQSDERLSVGLCYPGTYEVAQANQALQILYALASEVEGVTAERVFIPWIDMIDALRAHDVELFTLESYRPVRDLDVMGITIPYELSATTILEILDLSSIPFYATQRDESMPLIIGGGPGIANPEPFAPFFDAFFIGEAEEAWPEILTLLRDLKEAGASRGEELHALAQIEGMYIPSFYDVTYDDQGHISAYLPQLGAPMRVVKRIVEDFDQAFCVTRPVVPFAEAVHDRFALEVLRGCARGCRFCQAGMTTRPVREKKADTIVAQAIEGLQQTGYDEVSLTSLSTADHSQLPNILRRLTSRLHEDGVSVSLPSLRVDAFSVDMAHLIAAGGRKTGLTFAPEAGSQRLRDVINKNVTEEQLLDTVRRAFESGWRRIKLYFMIGLPTETDDDIRAIGELASRVLEIAYEVVPRSQKGNITVGVSVSTLVPKAHTPFQWEPQVTGEEIARKQQVLREATSRKGIRLSWHDAETSFLEGVVARGDRRLAPVLVKAWENGSRLDAWSELFNAQRWYDAFEACEYDAQTEATRTRSYDEVLPWDHLDFGVEKSFLKRERTRAENARTTPDCTFQGCTGCGVCPALDTDNVLAGGERR